MSGFERDTKYYGDRLVYNALDSKWRRYHRHCGCGGDWLQDHAVPAGFTVLRSGSGWGVIAGPGLTEGVDESRLTTNALWEAVTGLPGTQDWFETVRVTDRSPAAEAARKAENKRIREERAKHSAAAAKEPVTAPQLRYLESLARHAGPDRFDAEFARAVKGTGVAARRPGENARQAAARLTKGAARALITALKEGPVT